MQFECPGCGSSVWATIVDAGDHELSTSRWVYRCPVGSCLTTLGPVAREETAKPAPRAPVDLSVSTTYALATAVVSHAGPVTDPIDALRAELGAVEARIAADTPRRAILRRIVAAADRRPRATKSNVVSLARKVAP